MNFDWTAAAFGLFCLCVCYVTFGGPEEHEPVVTRSEYGTVTSISDCDAGKYSYRCNVQTNLGGYWDMDISDFPGGASVGDVLFIQRIDNGREITTSMCKNNSCQAHSSCMWWMMCFGRK